MSKCHWRWKKFWKDFNLGIKTKLYQIKYRLRNSK